VPTPTAEAHANYSWEIARPYQASSFNLKANATYRATVGSRVTGNNVTNYAPNQTTFDIQILEGAATLVASGFALAAALAL